MVAASTPSAALGFLQATLAHDYYGGAFSEFALVPLPATAALLHRLGLRLLHDHATLSFVATPSALTRITGAAYQAALSTTSFCWQLVPRSAGFAAFTAVDYSCSTQALVLTPPLGGNTRTTLTVGTSASALDLWPRQSLRFDFQPAQPLRTGSVLLLKTADGTLLRELPVTDPQLLALDTRDFGPGLYQLANGNRVLTRWFADERPYPPAAGAVLVLPGPTVAKALTAATRGRATTTTTYTASFPARTALWRYHIFNTQPDEALSIVALGTDSATNTGGRAAAKKNMPGVQFQPFSDPALPSAKSFAATRPLPLVLQPSQRFALHSGNTTRYAPLPLAGLALARAADDAALCSDIFVYL